MRKKPIGKPDEWAFRNLKEENMTNNMTKEQIERYLNILEEKNRIADGVYDKMLTRSDNFDLKNGQLVCLNNIADALSSLNDLNEVARGLIYIGDEIAKQNYK